MAWCARLLAALLLTLVVGAGGAAAHSGGSAYILVTADFLLPGQPFEVVAADMGPDASVSFRIEHEPAVALLGTIRAAPDGHFMTNLVVPADFPTGHAELFATAATGAAVSTWVLVGERTASTSPVTGKWWTDPSALVLIALLIGALGAIAYLVLRRQASRQPSRDRRSAN